jgi:hypothetical protein
MSTQRTPASPAIPLHLAPALRRIGASLLVVALAGCGGSTEPVATPEVPGSAQQVEARIGNVTANVVAMQTSNIPEEVARRNGLERRGDLVMLMVSPRQGASGTSVSAPVQVQATATDLRGQVTTLEMREIEVDGLIDHVGTVQTTLPDTLRFDVMIATPEGARQSVQLVREFRAL